MKESTIEKNKAFLHACRDEINASRFVITTLISDYKVSSSLFYSAARLGYFDKYRTKKHTYKYTPMFTELTDEDVVKITMYTYSDVSESKGKTDAMNKLCDLLPVKKPEFIMKNQTEILPVMPIKTFHSHLQDESDEDLIAELKRRGYSGTIEIKKTVTI